MSDASNNFLESLQYQIFLRKNVIAKDKSYQNQVEKMKQSMKEIGENMVLIRRRADFRLVMKELDKMIEKIN